MCSYNKKRIKRKNEKLAPIKIVIIKHVRFFETVHILTAEKTVAKEI